jgi:hypothetical protein
MSLIVTRMRCRAHPSGHPGALADARPATHGQQRTARYTTRHAPPAMRTASKTHGQQHTARHRDDPPPVRSFWRGITEEALALRNTAVASPRPAASVRALPLRPWPAETPTDRHDRQRVDHSRTNAPTRHAPPATRTASKTHSQQDAQPARRTARRTDNPPRTTGNARRWRDAACCARGWRRAGGNGDGGLWPPFTGCRPLPCRRVRFCSGSAVTLGALAPAVL